MGTSRCPACGAAVRTDAPWCLLCHRDLRSAPESVTARVDRPVAGPAPQLAAAAPSVEAGPTWPCAVCGVGNDLAAPTCTGCGAAFLAPLRHEGRPGLRLPVVGEVTRLSRNARLALAAGAGLLVAVVLSGIVLAVGSLL